MLQFRPRDFVTYILISFGKKFHTRGPHTTSVGSRISEKKHIYTDQITCRIKVLHWNIFSNIFILNQVCLDIPMICWIFCPQRFHGLSRWFRFLPYRIHVELSGVPIHPCHSLEYDKVHLKTKRKKLYWFHFPTLFLEFHAKYNFSKLRRLSNESYSCVLVYVNHLPTLSEPPTAISKQIDADCAHR